VVEGVSVMVGTRAILDSAGFTAPPGKVTGLVGPNGSGKSTLIATLIGLRQRSDGSIRFGGADLPGMPPADRARRVAYVEQFASTTERLTVRDVVALGRLPFQPDWRAEHSPRDNAIVAAAIAELGLTEFGTRLYFTLSGGEQQRVQVARALAQQPQLLLLDEPTSHLDIAAQLTVMDVLTRKAAAGATVLVALHDLNLAARYCDHLVVLSNGRVDGRAHPPGLWRGRRRGHLAGPPRPPDRGLRPRGAAQSD
jgi:iron complex transport system ATP-binding protein